MNFSYRLIDIFSLFIQIKKIFFFLCIIEDFIQRKKNKKNFHLYEKIEKAKTICMKVIDYLIDETYEQMITTKEGSGP